MTPEPIDALLERVERLDRDATPGPWAHVALSHTPGVLDHHAIEGPHGLSLSAFPYRLHRSADGRHGGYLDHAPDISALDLIAAYRTDAPVLAAEVRRLREQVARLESALETADSQAEHYQSDRDALARRLDALESALERRDGSRP